MTDVYISFDREDLSDVQIMAALLKAKDFDVQPDFGNDDSDLSEFEARRERFRAKCVLAVWSKSSVKPRSSVRAELSSGIQRNRLISVLLEPVEVPSRFKRAEKVNLIGWEQDPNNLYWRELVKLVEKKVGRKKKAPWWYRALIGAGIVLLALLMCLLLFAVVYYWQDIVESSPRPDSSVGDTIFRQPGIRSPRTDAYTPQPLGRDCKHCPDMVLIPAGSFEMGEEQGDWKTNTTPQHDVTFAKPFAVAIHEVTWGEWFACQQAGYCKPAAAGYPDDKPIEWYDQPVTHVTWHEIREDYLEWLNRDLDLWDKDDPYRRFRLLSEAEWERVARAGSTTAYSFGDNDADLCDHGNGRDRSSFIFHPSTNLKCYDGFGAETAPVMSFPANPFGVYDMHGNVWEWVEDCYRPNYEGAPDNGRAWTAGECAQRVIRGGSWESRSAHLRSSYRARREPHTEDWTIGFRLARDCPPKAVSADECKIYSKYRLSLGETPPATPPATGSGSGRGSQRTVR